MLKDLKTGFLGGGQMAEAILAGALEAGVLKAENVTVTDVDAARLRALEQSYGVSTLENRDGKGAAALAGQCGAVVLAVKPQYLKSALEGFGGCFGPDTPVLSIVGGVTLATLEALLPQSPVLRVMPNTPMLVRRGCAGIAAGSRATRAQVALAQELFGAVGQSWLLEEKLIDPLTSVSGCGPAFACLFIEALADGGVEQGLPREVALQLAAQTLAGTAEMMLATNRHPGQLKDAVCSPAGGTIAGVHALESGGLRAAVMDAVAAARRRMEELGRESAQ